MSIGFVHLSDIHFGQERGGKIYVHNDVKERLIEDVQTVVASLSNGRAAGLIVTGDIAYGGKEAEYKAAAIWLDRVAEAAGCAITEVQVIPGNHDIDRDEITPITEIMIREITTHGQPMLDKFLGSEVDRALLYRRFSAFSPFADGYRCPLDVEGGLAEERVVNLAEGRSIRFIRLNSALICSKRDEEGKLLLGERQRVLPNRPGEELVVLSHHPLNWFQDSEDARRFIRNRARLFISGHEHNPSVRLETVEEGSDLMMLAAGATVPPQSDEVYTYTYNVLEFDWNEALDALSVQVHPRAWVDQKKRFDADEIRLGGQAPCFVLACPRFRKAPRPTAPLAEIEANPDCAAETIIIHTPSEAELIAPEPAMADPYPLLVLRFFRDISASQRLKILVDLGALPEDWTDILSHPNERLILDNLIKAGRGDELTAVLEEVLR